MPGKHVLTVGGTYGCKYKVVELPPQRRTLNMYLPEPGYVRDGGSKFLLRSFYVALPYMQFWFAEGALMRGPEVTCTNKSIQEDHLYESELGVLEAIPGLAYYGSWCKGNVESHLHGYMPQEFFNDFHKPKVQEETQAIEKQFETAWISAFFHSRFECYISDRFAKFLGCDHINFMDADRVERIMTTWQAVSKANPNSILNLPIVMNFETYLRSREYRIIESSELSNKV